ncbi:MAG: electron transport complex subunit RsxC [Eubacterium sp.]|nr:electron transport complex subunit RsxC [Eubacterium sp.]
MGLKTFIGGVHPYDGKELSKDKEIVPVQPKSEMVYPLSQHIGAPANPVVKVGDEVKKGQVIAEAGGFVSAPIHSSVSGKVKKIEPRRVAAGGIVNSIIIENDGNYDEVEYERCEDYTSLTADEIRKRIQDAGVVGLGGAGFPTHVKLSPAAPEKIDYIIANCAECEPYLTSDYRMMLDMSEKLIEGMKIILSLFDGAKGVFGIEDNKKDCIAKLSELTAGEPNIMVQPLMTKYPQGAERNMIYAVTGRKINSSMLPADAGCIVDNVATICAVYDAVVEGKPIISRVVTITGEAVKDPRNFLVPTGTCFRDVVEEAGGFTVKPAKLIYGGPMMGFANFTLDIPVGKTNSALLAFSEDEAYKYEPTACIGCGRCVDVCPSRIVPSRLADFSEQGRIDIFEQWGGAECVECGSCSFVCPAKRHLALAVKSMRKQVLANRKKK